VSIFLLNVARGGQLPVVHIGQGAALSRDAADFSRLPVGKFFYFFRPAVAARMTAS